MRFRFCLAFSASFMCRCQGLKVLGERTYSWSLADSIFGCYSLTLSFVNCPILGPFIHRIPEIKCLTHLLCISLALPTCGLECGSSTAASVVWSLFIFLVLLERKFVIAARSVSFKNERCLLETILEGILPAAKSAAPFPC